MIHPIVDTLLDTLSCEFNVNQEDRLKEIDSKLQELRDQQQETQLDPAQLEFLLSQANLESSEIIY